jgi:hypothetical protein
MEAWRERQPERSPGRLSERLQQWFMADLASVWAEHGRAAMELTAKTMPSVFFATAARVLPKDVAISIEQSYPGGLAPDDIAILRAIKEAIPDANSRSPQEVLSFVAEAVRAHSAKTIEPSKDRALLSDRSPAKQYQ